MDGNSAKKAPILDHLVDTSNADSGNESDAVDPKKASNLPLWAVANRNGAQNNANGNEADGNAFNAQNTTSKKNLEPNAASTQNHPQNRRTDKSKFELELTQTVNRIMHKHFENASEQIVQQVLNEVRARLPGQKKP